MGIFDTTLVAEIAAFVVVAMQAIKTHPKVRGSMIPILSVLTGVAATAGWYLVTGNLNAADSPLNLDWINVYRSVANGIAGAIAANAGYNVQKLIGTHNILPTATEIDASAVKETIAKRELVAQAVAEGVSPAEAKHAVGLDDADPPATPVLEQLAPAEATVVAVDAVAPSVVDVRRQEGERHG